MPDDKSKDKEIKDGDKDKGGIDSSTKTETRGTRTEPSEVYKRRMEKRWAAQVKQGINPPANAREQAQRLKESHGY